MLKKNKFSFLLVSIFVLISLIVSNAYAYSKYSIGDDFELNWYFVNRGKDLMPECPKEATGLLSKYNAYYLGDTNEKVIYLTFDEGYENGYTAKILDILRDEKVPAAFFVVKPYIVQNPEIVKRMADEGHLVCNHSNHHPSMASVTDPQKFKSEFIDVENAYKEVVGSDMPKFFRPPMGQYSQKSLAMTKDLGYKTVFWSFAYGDYEPSNQPSPYEGKKNILDHLHDGSILLLHAISKTNADILGEVIDEARKSGYEFYLLP